MRASIEGGSDLDRWHAASLASMMMTGVRLRRWRLDDAGDIAVMGDDEYIGPWSTIGQDLGAWIRSEVAEERGPTRAICRADDDRAIGRVSVRLPEFASDAVRCEAVHPADQPAGETGYWLAPEARGQGLAYAAVRAMVGSVLPESRLRSVVLDIETSNIRSIRLAQRLGAERRSPTRTKPDRAGATRTLVVFVLQIPRMSGPTDIPGDI